MGLKSILYNQAWSLNVYSKQFLRKTKSFNKSRFSRNRQYYRTGVYWCLWLNIIAVFSLYYLFYRFTFRFSYVPYIYLFFILFSINIFFLRNYYLGFIYYISNFINEFLYYVVYFLSLINIFNKFIYPYLVVAYGYIFYFFLKNNPILVLYFYENLKLDIKKLSPFFFRQWLLIIQRHFWLSKVVFRIFIKKTKISLSNFFKNL